MRNCCAVAVLVCFSFLSHGGEDSSELLRTMQKQLELLTSRMDQQARIIAEQQQKIDEQNRIIGLSMGKRSIGSSPGAAILERIEDMEYQVEHATKLASRKPAESTIKVEAAIDTAFRYFDGDASETDRPAGNDFSVRSAQLSFSGTIDKHFKAFMVLNAIPSSDENDEAAMELEEAAVVTTSLSPVRVRGGRVFADVGRFSSFHTHDLPFVTRPGSLERYVGGESVADGIDVQAELPISHLLRITGGVFNKVGEEFPLLNATGDRRNGAELTFLLKALSSFDIGDAHTFSAGVSTLQVPDQLIRRNLINLELLYSWRPDGRNKRLVWGSELMRNEQRTRFITNLAEVELGDDPILKRESRSGFGGYSYLEYFYNTHWSFGARVDAFQNTDPSVETRRTYEQTYSLFTTYRFSESSLLRFEAGRHEFFSGNSANEFFLQWTVLLGGHSHDTHDH
ncbi:MAG TPA: porin [Planctomycetota bacterium]|nr:porin [Planctomycetota bacterium]